MISLRKCRDTRSCNVCHERNNSVRELVFFDQYKQGIVVAICGQCRKELSDKLTEGQMARAIILLKAAKEMIEKIQYDEFATVHYDEADCDKYCLMTDIQTFLECGE